MFSIFPGDPSQLPALTLAYIGDAVYELYVRNNLLISGNRKVQDLHQQAIKRVNASTQARLVESIEGILTEKELAITRRGRNAKSGQIPKNAEVMEYRKSTGLEALIGYLYLTEDYKRIEELLKKIEDIVNS